MIYYILAKIKKNSTVYLHSKVSFGFSNIISCFCVNTPVLFTLSAVDNHGSIQINGAPGLTKFLNK